MELEQPLAPGRIEQLKTFEHDLSRAIARTVHDGAALQVLRGASRFGDRGLTLSAGLVLAFAKPIALRAFAAATAAALLIQCRLKVLCARQRPCARPGGPPHARRFRILAASARDIRCTP